MVSLTSPLLIGVPEWLWIALLAAVLLFGSNKIPQIAKAIGKAMGEFQKGRDEIEREIRAASEGQVQTAPPSLSTTKEELQKVAAALGIDAATKSEEELRRAIKRRLES